MGGNVNSNLIPFISIHDSLLIFQSEINIDTNNYGRNKHPECYILQAIQSRSLPATDIGQVILIIEH
jgi:hypothetical protein